MRELWSALFGFGVVLLVLLVVSLPFVEPGTPTAAITKASFVLIVVTLAGLLAVIRSGWDPFAPE